jgi:hypothetical protein
MTATTEHGLKRGVDRWLTETRRAGARLWWVKLHPGWAQRRGLPDYLIVAGGRWVAVELKHPSGRARLRARQTVERRALTWAGATYHVCTSVADVAAIVTSLLRAGQDSH